MRSLQDRGVELRHQHNACSCAQCAQADQEEDDSEHGKDPPSRAAARINVSDVLLRRAVHLHSEDALVTSLLWHHLQISPLELSKVAGVLGPRGELVQLQHYLRWNPKNLRLLQLRQPQSLYELLQCGHKANTFIGQGKAEELGGVGQHIAWLLVDAVHGEPLGQLSALLRREPIEGLAWWATGRVVVGTAEAEKPGDGLVLR
mmetsp:Transcript_29229/g.68017  ORF Transcript_29229/g.68017 Transcript_29229/m.68017 type:complete len:203 (+) Transcript_29229:421-1029(+)